MIEGVVIKKLIRHCDDRGCFMEVLRDDDKLLKKFGQTSYTVTYPGVIKAFHYHKKQDDLWFVASGMAQVVLHDLRKDSKTYKETQVIYAGEDNPLTIVIPVGVAHGYRVLGDKPVCLFYHTTESYKADSPDEERIPFDDKEIGFDWTTQNR
ncbi:dTDP-4-dehydrorhamnose 3,5-epimerase family protein [Candidatus Peregrinibacteria bacterium]|nr:dTDP-4-dehydrorhamnose 3,5-epimerase family protein [Candidatus Peregrinibacteria bacterium]